MGLAGGAAPVLKRYLVRPKNQRLPERWTGTLLLLAPKRQGSFLDVEAAAALTIRNTAWRELLELGPRGQVRLEYCKEVRQGRPFSAS